MSTLPIRMGCRILVLASLGLVSSAAIAKAKVIWNDPIPFSTYGRSGIWHASPLDRAERLAWRQNITVQRPGYTFVPSLVTPFWPLGALGADGLVRTLPPARHLRAAMRPLTAMNPKGVGSVIYVTAWLWRMNYA